MQITCKSTVLILSFNTMFRCCFENNQMTGMISKSNVQTTTDSNNKIIHSNDKSTIITNNPSASDRILIEPNEHSESHDSVIMNDQDNDRILAQADTTQSNPSNIQQQVSPHQVEFDSTNDISNEATHRISCI